MRTLQRIKEKQAQAIMSEYVLMFFLVFASISAMTVYFQRAIQARIKSARNTMGNIIKDRAPGTFNVILREYEPYYMNTSVDVAFDDTKRTGHFLGGGTRVEVDSTVTAQSTSETAPPKFAK